MKVAAPSPLLAGAAATMSSRSRPYIYKKNLFDSGLKLVLTMKLATPSSLLAAAAAAMMQAPYIYKYMC